MRFFTLLFLSLIVLSAHAQKVSFKDDIVYVDKVSVVKVIGVKNKAMMGLVKDYTVKNMKGVELMAAVYADYMPEDPNDNTIYYFEFTFTDRTDTVIFPLGKLSTDKSLANLIGKNNIIKNDSISILN